eukprot:scaffold4761_cov263-Chaetoceros_neogracile.AAC.1
MVVGAVNLISSYHCRYLPFMIDEWPLTNDEIDATYVSPSYFSIGQSQDGSAVRKLIILQVQQSSVQDMAMAKHMERVRIVARRSFK